MPTPPVPAGPLPRVVTRVKADMRCAAVAAASVLAKVERDALMVDLAGRFPRYNWHENKGYSAPDHLAALAAEGPCDQHRRSWSLPGVGGDPMLVDLAGLEASRAGQQVECCGPYRGHGAGLLPIQRVRDGERLPGPGQGVLGV